MYRKMLYPLLAILVIILLAFAAVRISRYFQMEACIKKGGFWNKELNRCETPDSTLLLKDYYWHTVHDSIRQAESLQKGQFIDSLSSSPAELIDILNKRPEKCKIQFIGLQTDTLHIRILNEEVLTEQLGSAGAHNFLGETVFTLTENNAVKRVKIDFNEGSHAWPGIYSRADFNDLAHDDQ